jgi:hypothetical protein
MKHQVGLVLKEIVELVIVKIQIPILVNVVMAVYGHKV